jgi:hypothetical protein
MHEEGSLRARPGVTNARGKGAADLRHLHFIENRIMKSTSTI